MSGANCSIFGGGTKLESKFLGFRQVMMKNVPVSSLPFVAIYVLFVALINSNAKSLFIPLPETNGDFL